MGPRLRGGGVRVIELDDVTGFDALVVSPGVPLNTHPLAATARAAGVPIIGDIELFAQARSELPAHKVVGITGTNGKSTTTALVHHILKTAGVPTRMGGNIGLPILAQEPLPEGHPILSAPNTVLTPHLGYVTAENYRAYFAGAVEAVEGYLKGNPVRVLRPD